MQRTRTSAHRTRCTGCWTCRCLRRSRRRSDREGLMYERFYGMRERPFELTPDPRFLLLTKGHQEALSNLEYGISFRRGFTVLIGEAGTGKTTLLRKALGVRTQEG